MLLVGKWNIVCHLFARTLDVMQFCYTGPLLMFTSWAANLVTCLSSIFTTTNGFAAIGWPRLGNAVENAS